MKDSGIGSMDLPVILVYIIILAIAATWNTLVGTG
jgi:hypothetical protein